MVARSCPGWLISAAVFPVPAVPAVFRGRQLLTTLPLKTPTFAAGFLPKSEKIIISSEILMTAPSIITLSEIGLGPARNSK